MDESSFDTLTRQLARGGSRRWLLSRLGVFGGAALVASSTLDDAQAGWGSVWPPKLSIGDDEGDDDEDGDGDVCDCPDGRICLSNGSCALPCTDSAQCKELGCEACWNADPGTAYCGLIDPRIEANCQQNSDNCPTGWVCSGLNYCVELC